MQRRSHEYNVPVTSFLLDQQKQGFYPKGRYFGLDTMANGGGVGINIILSHTSGLIMVNHTPSALEVNPFAVVVTPMGQVVQFDDTVTLSVASNVSNAFERIDYVIMNHEYVQVAGGAAATFSILTGANGGPVAPTLANPEKQVILGTIRVAASASTYAGLTWTKAETPIFGNKNLAEDSNLIAAYARLTYSNKYTKSETHEVKSVQIADIVSEHLTIGEGKLYKFNAFPPGGVTIEAITTPTEGAGRVIVLDASLSRPISFQAGVASPNVGFSAIGSGSQPSLIPGGGGNVTFKTRYPVALRYNGTQWQIIMGGMDMDQHYRLMSEGWATRLTPTVNAVNGTVSSSATTIAAYVKAIGEVGEQAPFNGQASTTNSGRTLFVQLAGTITLTGGSGTTWVEIAIPGLYFNTRRDQIVPFLSDTTIGASSTYMGKATFKSGSNIIRFESLPSAVLNDDTFGVYLSVPVEGHPTTGS